MRLNTRAFAIAGGAVASGSVFLLTFVLLLRPGDATGPQLLADLLFGYSVSVAGAFIGAMWAYAYGFLLAGLFAFVYNLAVPPPLPPAVD